MREMGTAGGGKLVEERKWERRRNAKKKLEKGKPKQKHKQDKRK